MKKLLPFRVKTTIALLINNEDGWSPMDYILEYRAEWDNERVPIIVAIPNKMMEDYSPMFCALPNGKIISRKNTDGFSQILEAYFPQIMHQEALMLAELALKFGNFPHYPGTLWKGNLDQFKHLKQKLRPTSDPIFHQEGNRTTIDFYAYDYELLSLSDCRVEIIGNKCAFHAQSIKE